MEAGYFLDIADNTGDEFSYEILPVDTANRIPKYHNPVTLIISVVCSRTIDSIHAPSFDVAQLVFKFCNISGDEFFGTEETKRSPYS